MYGKEILKETYNVCEDGTSQKDHVPSSRRIFYPDLEFLFFALSVSKCNPPKYAALWKGKNTHAQSLGVSLQDSGEPELLEFLFQSAGKTGVHAATTGQDDSLVQT